VVIKSRGICKRRKRRVLDNTQVLWSCNRQQRTVAQIVEAPRKIGVDAAVNRGENARQRLLGRVRQIRSNWQIKILYRLRSKIIENHWYGPKDKVVRCLREAD
jgi:hypothetical protein